MKEKGKKILICDDNVGFLRIVADMLKFHGYEPLVAKTGGQALEKAAKLGPDLVLLDYRLPDMDGTTALGELKTVDETLPIIIMTGFGHNHGRGFFGIGPVAAHKGVRLMPGHDALIGIDGDDIRPSRQP